MADKTANNNSAGGIAKSTWTEAEKLGLMFQIIARSGAIPWDDLQLPEGRTRKACQVMIDKEKQKVKKAMAEMGIDITATATPVKGGKRKTAAETNDHGDGVGDDSEPPKKKGKAGTGASRQKKEVGDDGADAIKAEEVDEC